jgi:hypothetical protein
MTIDIYQKSSELLEQLANSIFDRDTSNPNPLCFSMTEIHIVENWLREILNNHILEPDDLNNNLSALDPKSKTIC